MKRRAVRRSGHLPLIRWGRGLMTARRGNLSHRPWCFTVAILVVCATSVSAGQFQPPDLTGFSRHDQRQADGDGDGIPETQIVQYLNPRGDSIVSMTTGGRLWAWSLETRDNGSSLHNYVIRDSDCDGVFDEVYSLDDKFHVPDCLK